MVGEPSRTHSTGPFRRTAPQQDVEASCRPIGCSQSKTHATRSADGSRHPRASAKKYSWNPPEAALREGQLAGWSPRGQHCSSRVAPIFWTGTPGIRTNQSESTIRLSKVERTHDSDKILIWTPIRRRYLNLESSPCQNIYRECPLTAKDYF